MEIDRQPSPWPCVAMLAGLLLLCLMAPRYWHNGAETDATSPPIVAEKALPASANYLQFGVEERRRLLPSFGGVRADVDPLQIWAPPTIEELVAARAGVQRLETQLFDWPVIAPTTTRPVRERPATSVARPAVPGPLAKAAFERIGQMLVDYYPMDALAQLSSRVANLHRTWSSIRVPVVQQEITPSEAVTRSNAPPSTLRLLDPENGSDIVPPQVVSVPHNAIPLGTSPTNDPWCVPQVLLEQLERLARHAESGDWAQHTIAQLQALTARDRLDGSDVQSILAALGDSTQAAAQMADQTGEDRLRVELLRAHWGLARRLDCWTALHDIRVAERSRERVALHGPLGSFFNSAPVPYVETSSAKTLSADLETYERSRDPQLGRQVVRQQQALQSSPDALDRSLADSVERHYRNANVRVAVTAELLNRLVAREHSEVQALRERIAGTPVRGRSHVQSGSRVRLDPATGHWRMTVEAEGEVDSYTLADGGSARLRSHSATDFAARKSIFVDRDGVQMKQTVARANSHNRLVDVTTDFDWVPLFGSVARDRAAAQYRARRERAKTEIEWRVSNLAVDQVDRETLEAVERIERQVRSRLTDRLSAAGVDLTPIEMSSTQERVVGRFRVAGEHQLGSHTPRPRALSDSLASVQVHETALTNAAVTLSLDGGRYTGAELQQLFREKFPRLTTQGDSARDDVAFKFAQEHAVQFHISEGRLELALTLPRVELDGRTMRDVIVHAYYVPVVNGLEAELTRDGSLGIEGRLSSSDRARLHNVFNSVLPAERPLPVLQLDNPDDPRLEGLMITQLVLEDGWLGLAVGPAHRERVAERSRSLH